MAPFVRKVLPTGSAHPQADVRREYNRVREYLPSTKVAGTCTPRTAPQQTATTTNTTTTNAHGAQVKAGETPHTSYVPLHTASMISPSLSP